MNARFSSGWRTTRQVIDPAARHPRQNREQFAAEIISPFAPASDPDETKLSRRAGRGAGRLPADQRAVVHLKLWEGLTFEQIADALDIPLNTAGQPVSHG